MMLAGDYSTTESKCLQAFQPLEGFLFDVQPSIWSCSQDYTQPMNITVSHWMFLIAAEKLGRAFHPKENGIPIEEMIQIQEKLPIRSKDDLRHRRV